MKSGFSKFARVFKVMGENIDIESVAGKKANAPDARSTSVRSLFDLGTNEKDVIKPGSRERKL